MIKKYRPDSNTDFKF